mmetsp:Transcript_25193/g.37708  ORF Transcript_25193/g.37708 Transcript_25193/m.37708 type:complete len:122 (+) Transcript_25193:3-368(+)
MMYIYIYIYLYSFGFGEMFVEEQRITSYDFVSSIESDPIRFLKFAFQKPQRSESKKWNYFQIFLELQSLLHLGCFIHALIELMNDGCTYLLFMLGNKEIIFFYLFLISFCKSNSNFEKNID